MERSKKAEVRFKKFLQSHRMGDGQTFKPETGNRKARTVAGVAKAQIFEAAVRVQKGLVLAFKKPHGRCAT
jgi:hypothetical protein